MERLLIVAAGVLVVALVLAVALVSRYDSDKQGSVDAPPRAEVGRRATTTERPTFLLRRRVAIKGSSNPAVNIDKQVPILATGSPEEQLEILKAALPETHTSDGKFAPGNKAATLPRAKTLGLTMAKCRSRIPRLLKREDFDAIWAKVVEGARKGSFKHIQMYFQYCVGTPDDMELQQAVDKIKREQEKMDVKGTIGKIG